jgi:hypothetical protein
MSHDPYSVCRYVRHYQSKNGYAPRIQQLVGADVEYACELAKNGIIELWPPAGGKQQDDETPTSFYLVTLTEKGFRMSQEQRHARGGRR